MPAYYFLTIQMSLNSVPIDNRQLFIFEGSQVSYQRFGTGSLILLAFHGFGQNSQVYQPLTDWQKSRFTVLSIDLFFHGNSLYPGQQLLTKYAWQRLLTAFLDAHHIDRFSVVGFSLGGRFALVTVELFANRLDQLILLAPDGITQSFWYRMATNSLVGRRVFHYVLRHLPLLTSVGHTLTRLGLLNRSVMRFVELSLATPQQRLLVHQSWTQFRLLQPDLRLVSRQLNQLPIYVCCFVGAFDRLVPGSTLLPLTKRLKQYTLNNLRTGHNHLIDMMAQANID